MGTYLQDIRQIDAALDDARQPLADLVDAIRVKSDPDLIDALAIKVVRKITSMTETVHGAAKTYRNVYGAGR